MKNKIFTLILCALAAQGADAKVRHKTDDRRGCSRVGNKGQHYEG